MEISNIARKYRENLGLEVNELCEQTGIKYPLEINIIEDPEKESPSYDLYILKRLVKAFGLPFLYEVMEIEPPKPTLEYVIPIQPEDAKVKEMNESLGTNFMTTLEHIEELLDDKLCKAILESGKSWYVGDSIQVAVYIEYKPEDK